MHGGDGDNPLEIELSDDPNEYERLDVSNVPVLVTLTKVCPLHGLSEGGGGEGGRVVVSSLA